MNRHAYIFSAPDHRVAPDLLFWLLRHGFTDQTIHFVNESRDISVAFNTGIMESYVLRHEMTVFCDNDMHPSQATDAFFYENRFQIQCVKYPCEHAAAFGSQIAFHTGIWRASQQTISRIIQNCETFGDSPFAWPTIHNGATMTGCACSHLSRVAMRAGISIGHIGEAGHFPRGVKSTIHRIVTYGNNIDPRLIYNNR